MNGLHIPSNTHGQQVETSGTLHCHYHKWSVGPVNHWAHRGDQQVFDHAVPELPDILIQTTTHVTCSVRQVACMATTQCLQLRLFRNRVFFLNVVNSPRHAVTTQTTRCLEVDISRNQKPLRRWNQLLWLHGTVERVHGCSRKFVTYFFQPL